MKLNLNNITFIIVCFKSENVIYNCLNSLPKECKKIVIENSKNIKLKNDLETNYDNIEVLINDNLGMGASNNIGISMAKTNFVYILNPDTKLQKNTLDILIQESDKLDDFAIISPISSNETFPNYKIFKKENINQDIFEVDRVDGFSMLLNKEKFDNKFFDENFFLYLENDDLCLRVKKKKEKIYIIRKSRIDHLGSSSSSDNKSKDFEYLRNWHWMWSKFYFNKKHSGYLISIIKIFPNLISASLKFFLYFILFQAHKKNIYKMRILGIYNSLIGKKSYYRIF